TPRPALASPLFPYTTLFRSSASRSPPRSEAPGRAHPRERGSHKPQAFLGFVASGSRTAARYRPRRRVLRVVKPEPRSMISERGRSEEHTSELQSRFDLVCRL